ncbi:MAG: AAA domain-containing protein [Symploca sp. SIO2G7]|nr:AAA domain-containing protein [Symploca sp. SIO2G7]
MSSESNTLTWGDIKDAAELAFRGFENPGLEFGALEWAKEAWEILINSDLATYSDETQRNQVIIRFLALASFYLEFCHVAWEEDVDPDYYNCATTLNFIDYDAAHYYAEQLIDTDSDRSVLDDEDYELDNSDLQNLAENVREEVISALTDSFDNISELFVFLWESNLPESEEKEFVSCDTDSEILQDDLISNKQAAFEWLTQQCSTKLFEEAEILQKNTVAEHNETRSENSIDIDFPFSMETFTLLENLHNKPKFDFYIAHEEEFKQYIENPFQRLFLKAFAQLPDKITKWMDMEKYLFCYTKWTFYYEGNLYPKRELLFDHKFNYFDIARLTLILFNNNLVFGLFIPDNCEDKKRFIKNVNQFSKSKIINGLKLSNNCTLHKNKKEQYRGGRLSYWLKNTYRKNTSIKSIQATVHLHKDRVIHLSCNQLIEQIRQTFEELFPLFLMAICDYPMPAIREYLNPISQLKFSFDYQSSIPSSKTGQKQESNASQIDEKLLVFIHQYVEPSFPDIYRKVLAQGLRISESTLRRYHLALKSRKFIILSGISGTGKTWLTKAYAEAVEAEYLLVPVAPNWTTNEDLLGYLSPMDNKYHDTDFSAFLKKAEEGYQQAQAKQLTPRPYYLVLDEMNLARVEYYFAKFLSAMEVRMREGVAQIQLASDKQVLLPPNLYFIGTVNVDETTHSFADKVYDRAQLIELEASRQDLYDHLGEVPYSEILMQIWDEVHTIAPFAFRVIDEIKIYVKEAEALEVSWQDALDEQLLQKILPKLKGADDRVGVALKEFVDIVKDKDFPLSYKKATKMLETFNQHGFTSYF